MSPERLSDNFLHALLEATKEVQRVLASGEHEERVRSVVIGGIAGIYYGVERVTRDVDLSVCVGDMLMLQVHRAALEQLGYSWRQNAADTDDVLGESITLQRDDLQIEIINFLNPYSRQAQGAGIAAYAVRHPHVDGELSFCSVEALVVFKTYARGPRDRADIRQLFRHNEELSLERVRDVMMQMKLEMKTVDAWMAELENILAAPSEEE